MSTQTGHAEYLNTQNTTSDKWIHLLIEEAQHTAIMQAANVKISRHGESSVVADTGSDRNSLLRIHLEIVLLYANIGRHAVFFGNPVEDLEGKDLRARA